MRLIITRDCLRLAIARLAVRPIFPSPSGILGHEPRSLAWILLELEIKISTRHSILVSDSFLRAEGLRAF